MNSWVGRHRILLVVVTSLLAVGVGLRVYSVRFERACAAEHPMQQKVEVDGIRLHYVAAGQRDPVVLLHGDGGSALDFTTSPIFDRLAERYRVIALDRPGARLQRRGRRGRCPA